MKIFFCYAARGSSSIANGNSEQQTITIASDSDFYMTEIRTTAEADLRITVAEANGTQHSNIALNCALVGAGEDGLRFPEAIKFTKNSQINVTFDNQSGGAVTYPEVQFWGFKVS